MGIADMIEELILRELSSSAENVLILRRNEIAEQIDCAPSQISYVLNTRFTLQRGFAVESRRGAGGYIRIARAAEQKDIFTELISSIGEETTVEQTDHLLQFLVKHGMMTLREAAIAKQIMRSSCGTNRAVLRAQILRDMLVLLREIAQEGKYYAVR